MQTVKIPDRMRPQALPPLIVLFALVIAVPILEFSSGNVPWSRPSPAFSAPGVASGEAARVFERRFADDSTVSRWIRPYYNEILFRLCKTTTDQVLVGKDGWLFESSNTKNYPRSNEAATIDRHVAAIVAIVEWFERQGTATVVLCVPNKWAFYPDKLPDLPVKPRAVYPEINRRLADSGLRVVDCAPALDPRHGPSFLPNDTHWTHAAARRTAELVAARLREEWGSSLPGEPVDAAYQEVSGLSHRGDLQRMLGFAEDSPGDRAFLVKKTMMAGVKRGTTTRLEPPSGQAVVCCGTSFSHTVGFPSLLSAATGRQVENLSLAGKGPTKTLLELAEGIRSGERAAPKLIVWEFPEKHVFSRAGDFAEPIEDFMLHAAQPSGIAWGAGRPLTWKERLPVNLTLEESADGGVKGTPTSGDPQIIVELDEPLPIDGSVALSFDIRADRRTRAKVVIDFGKGFDRDHALVVPIAGGSRKSTVLVPLVADRSNATDDRGSRFAKRLRIDPVESRIGFEMSAIEIRSK